jgi:hypothetical protein
MSMLDGTPMLFGASCDLDDPGDRSIGVCAVFTIEALKGVEVTQFVSIKDEVVGAPDLRDAIDGEGASLLDRAEKVEQ